MKNRRAKDETFTFSHVDNSCCWRCKRKGLNRRAVTGRKTQPLRRGEGSSALDRALDLHKWIVASFQTAAALHASGLGAMGHAGLGEVHRINDLIGVIQSRDMKARVDEARRRAEQLKAMHRRKFKRKRR